MIDYWTEQDRLADQHEANRASDLHEFFTAFDNNDTDPSYLVEREHELGVTILEWTSYREAKQQRLEAAYSAFPF